jgi:hypothetical protein
LKTFVLPTGPSAAGAADSFGKSWLRRNGFGVSMDKTFNSMS